MRPYYAAIVGSGPSGYFAAASVLKAGRFARRNRCPRRHAGDAADAAGLVRSGVAPDHPKIKSITAQFEKRASHPRFRFFGNIAVGEHVQADELAERYDAVIYAVGAQSDKPLRIPGEDLPGSIAAVELVGWYNAHPHFEKMSPDLSSGRAVVVRNGNVALDVARTGHRSRGVAHHRHRRPRAGTARPTRPRGRGDRRAARSATGDFHHVGAARTRRSQRSPGRRRDCRPGRPGRHFRRAGGCRGQDPTKQP
ncbi:FAD-dependent oxidoreductase [Mycobacterium paraintracellulare]|uniref:FAD-dependent oxidoreductase n=1 Tax=Mycobacterium paraintracellulare TaxID=1138383 RepID=UPI001927B5D9